MSLKNIKGKNFYIYFFLVIYFFFIAGVHIYAKCNNILNSSCPCCSSKVKTHHIDFSESSINMDDQQCPCSIKKTIHSSLVQLFSKVQQPLAKLSILINILITRIGFSFTDYYKIISKPDIFLNKNIKILRTVILLN